MSNKTYSVLMSDKTYNILKWVAILLLPSLATLVIALTGIWNLPYGEAIGATITAINAFLGGILGLSSNAYARQAESSESNNTSEEKGKEK